MILPVAKLGALLMKSLGKPLAGNLKKHAARHPRFRQIIVNFAQSNHRFHVNLQRRIYGHDTDVLIHPLNPEKAVQAASDVLGEFIIFAVAGIIVILEVQRNARSEALKEAKMRAELAALQEKDRCASTELEQLRMRIEELEKAISKGGKWPSWSPPSFSSVRKVSDQSQEIHSTSLVPSSSQNNATTEKAPQN